MAFAYFAHLLALPSLECRATPQTMTHFESMLLKFGKNAPSPDITRFNFVWRGRNSWIVLKYLIAFMSAQNNIEFSEGDFQKTCFPVLSWFIALKKIMLWTFWSTVGNYSAMVSVRESREASHINSVTGQWATGRPLIARPMLYLEVFYIFRRTTCT